MNVAGFAADELKMISQVLDAAAAEAAERDLDLPIAVMTRRVFAAAAWGERDPKRLRAQALGDALRDALNATTREPLKLGQGYQFMPRAPVWGRSIAATAATR